MLKAISPIDGRYAGKTSALSDYFSEYALIKYRVFVEVKYFNFLVKNKVGVLAEIDDKVCDGLLDFSAAFTEKDAERIKEIERTTNHDVKAVEYFIKEEFDRKGLEKYKEFIHFGLTSQDINNTSMPLMLKEAMQDVYIPLLEEIRNIIEEKAVEYKGIPMLAKTHGQPASPTTLGKEMMVFVERINDQLNILDNLPVKAKFGGATGNLNAHKVSFPDYDWPTEAKKFVEEELGLIRSAHTTQIAHYDHFAAIFMAISRINTILIDFCRDIWTYIMMEYFKQKVIANEVGSSAMPHKVNPIDFENAEGNLGMANAVFHHLAEKLPISRLQRDLTDSTVTRNIGVPFGHVVIALASIKKGMGKLLLNEEALKADLEKNWAVVAEAIQNVLRREQFPKPYEALKALTRGNTHITEAVIKDFIAGLDVSDAIKEELNAITPYNYVGYF